MKTTNPKISRRSRGFALLLVLTVIGITTILGFAVMAGTQLQVQTSKNTYAASAADSLAESGMNLAAYYLQYPSKAPSLNSLGYWPGGTGITFGTGVTGSVDVTVTNGSKNYYDITATGKYSSSSSNVTTRKISGRLYVNPGLQFRYGSMYSGSVSNWSNTTITGGVQVNGVLTNYGDINGNVVATSVTNSGSGSVSGNFYSLTSGNNQWPIPAQANLRNYQTYTYKGVSYNATSVGGSLNNTTLGATSSNPLGIYYRTNDLEIKSNVTITGMLIVSGNLTINGSSNTITGVDGYPALEVKSGGDLILKGTAITRDLTVNGVTWLGGDIKNSGLVLSGGFTFNGSLVFGNGGSVDQNYLNYVRVNYDATKANAPDMDTTVALPGTKFITWKQ